MVYRYDQILKKDKNKLFMIGIALVFAMTLMMSAFSVTNAATSDWYQGFEADTNGWFDVNSPAPDDWYGEVTRVQSGYDGITSAEGDWHAIFEGDSGSAPFSRFDGYSDTWTGTWIAEVDVYLDTGWAAGTGFDYSVAANGSDGNHQRDYIFHVIKDSSTGNLLVAGSNNTNFAPIENLETGNHFVVTTSGWYTLQHVFYNDGGSLSVDLNLLDSSGTILFTETRSNAIDLIPTEVGGNRYAWFTFINVDGGIAVDAHSLTRYPVGEITAPTAGGIVNGITNLTASYDDGDTLNDDIVQWAVRSDAACNVGSKTVAGNVNGHSDVATWDGASFSYSLNTAALSDGNYCFVFNPKDDAGENDVRETVIFEVDNTAPTKVEGVTIYKGNDTSGANLGCSGFTNERWITVDWDDSGDANFSYYRYQAKNGWSTTLVASQRTGQISDLDGMYKYRVQAVDKAGNVGEYSDWCYVTLDREAPVITLVAPVDGSTVRGSIDLKALCNEDCTYVNFWWRAEDESFSSPRYHYVRHVGTDFEWQLDTLAAELANGDTYIMEDGDYYFYAATKDVAGNWARSAGQVMVTVDNIPDDVDACKKGGWENYVDGLNFRNQGDCVSYVVSDKQHNDNPDAKAVASVGASKKAKK